MRPPEHVPTTTSPEPDADRSGSDRTRLGRLLRAGRWPILVVWLIVVAGTATFAFHLSRVTTDDPTANLPASAASTKVALLEQAAAHVKGAPESASAEVVFVRASGLTGTDRSAISATRLATVSLAGRVGGLGPPSAVRSSRDGKAALFSFKVTAPASGRKSADATAVKAVRAVVAAHARSVRVGLQAAVTGDAAANADSSRGGGGTAKLLLTSLVIVIVVLLAVYRRALLWLLPVLSAVAAVVVARAGAYGLAGTGLEVSTLSADISIVLVFGVATDYALLLVHRYREELPTHARTEEAMAAALQATIGALAASAATVAAALLCLLAASLGSLHGLGPIGAISVAAAFVAQITLLPALLLIGGRAVFWPRPPRPGQAGAESSRLWNTVGKWLGRRPGTIAAGTVVVLVALSFGLVAFHYDSNPISDIKGHPQSAIGETLLEAHFPPGALGPLVVAVDPAQGGAAVRVARSDPSIATVSATRRIGDRDAFSAELTVPPYRPAAFAAVTELRQRLGLSAPSALVGGDPAVALDTQNAANHDDIVLVPLILATILVLIALLLQAIVAPLVLVAASILSFGASFGLSNLLWVHGFGYAGVDPQVPMFIFVFLIAFGVDYNIFLITRVREETRAAGTQAGMRRGLAVTGGVITAAGVVLAGAFVTLIQLPTVQLAEVGVAVAIGVLLDTIIVRSVLVPAVILRLDRRTWWPNRLSRQPDPSR